MLARALDDASWASPWRGVHIGGKVLLCLGLLVTALVAPAWPGSVLVALSASWLALVCARIPARLLSRAMTAPAAFIALGGLSIAVHVGQPPPTSWFALGPLSITPASLHQALDVTAHSVAGTLAVLLLATTTPMVDLLTWLRRWRMPGPLVEVASLTYRLLFVLLGTAAAVRDASTARLGDAPRGPGSGRRRWLIAANTAGAVLTRSWHRIGRLQVGWEARGFDDELRVLPQRTALPAGFAAAAATHLVGVWVVITTVGLR